MKKISQKYETKFFYLKLHFRIKQLKNFFILIQKQKNFN